MTTKQAAMATIAVRQQVFLERVKSHEATKFDAFLREMDQVIRDALSGDELTDFQRTRLEALLADVDANIAAIQDRYWERLKTDVVDIAEYQAGFEAATLTKAVDTVEKVFEATIPSPAQIKTAVLTSPLSVRGPDGGKLLESFVTDWSAAQRKAFTGTIRRGYFEGQTNAQMVRTIRGTRALKYNDGLLSITKRGADAMVRTAVQHAASQARAETWKSNADLATEYEFVATLDGRTTAQCRSLDRRVFKIGKGPMPPLHINCLPGDSLVSARCGITGASKRWFNGELIVIRTASGRELACTPNHPILTNGGWIAAKSLNLGDKVVCDGGSEWTTGVHGNNQNMPASIHQVTEAILSHRQVLTVPVPITAPDFHGDGMDGDIAIVGAYRPLLDGRDATVTQHIEQRVLVSGNAPLGALHSCGKFGLFFRRLLSTANSIVCSTRERLSFFLRCPRHAGELLLALVASGNACVAKDPVDDVGGCAEFASHATDTNAGIKDLSSRADINGHMRDAAGRAHDGTTHSELVIHNSSSDTELARKLISGKSGAVFADKVVAIDRRVFAGHVFNLETVEGWYSAGGIITHNCRSTTILKLPSEFDFLDKGATRASVNGPVPQDLSYYQWLKMQPAEFQDSVIGPVRGKLFRDGGLSAERFAALQLDRNFQPLTLAEMRALEPLAFLRSGL